MNPGRWQPFYLLQTRQALTRLQVAHLLGVSRNTVGRWLAAYETGGVAEMLMTANPRVSPVTRPSGHDSIGCRSPLKRSTTNYPLFLNKFAHSFQNTLNICGRADP
jgi:hypothetical protein